MIRAEAAREAKLVDRVAYFDEVLDELKVATGRKASDRTFKQINLKAYSKLVGRAGKPVRATAEKVEFGGSGRGRVARIRRR